MADAVRAFARDRYVPVRDGINPANRGDAVRHGIVRAAFLSALNQDARVRLRFADWAQTAGLLPRMWALQEALRALGAVVSLPQGIRADEVLDQFGGGAASPATAAAAVRALQAVLVADRALVQRLRVTGADTALGEAIVRDANTFVGELGAPWPWLAAELVTQYAYWVTQARLYDARYAEHLDSRLWASAVRSLPRGKVPDKDVETLQRYARWFYRVRIGGEAVRAVAREEWGPEAVEERARDVRGGVRRAEALLALGQFRFPDGSA